MERGLYLITSLFIGIHEAYIIQMRGEPDQTIQITDALGIRDITIHPIKPEHVGHALH